MHIFSYLFYFIYFILFFARPLLHKCVSYFVCDLVCQVPMLLFMSWKQMPLIDAMQLLIDELVLDGDFSSHASFTSGAVS